MNLNNRKQAFVNLGKFLQKYTAENPGFTSEEEIQADLLDQAISTAIIHNKWFTKEDIFYNLKHWSKSLTSEKLNSWLASYNFKEENPKTVAIIMAGNVPLVGFHDFLSVLIS